MSQREGLVQLAIVYFGLGSNLGDRRANILAAVDGLIAKGVKARRLSALIETEPVGGVPQGCFLNAVMCAETDLAPEHLLNVLHEVEASLGRVRTIKNGPRTIDIDILLYGNLQLNSPSLVIPHPRMMDRPFVLDPLKEIAPDVWQDLRGAKCKS